MASTSSPFRTTGAAGSSGCEPAAMADLLCSSMRPFGRTSATAVRVGSRSDPSSRTPSFWPGVDRSSATSNVWTRTPSSASLGSSGAGPACHRSSVSRVRYCAFSCSRICGGPTAGSQATMRSPGSMDHLGPGPASVFQRSTAIPGATLSTVSAPWPFGPQVRRCSLICIPQPSSGLRATSASQTPGAESAALLEKQRASLSTLGFLSTSIMREAVVLSFTRTSRSPTLTGGSRQGAATFRL
mmetsp:Transcript_26661/g.75294  ORF Transcript_26661/g.75294 Transcript_26661/m.75294 type:complete len:242 (-) Transcript_26661:1856-2581(-)